MNETPSKGTPTRSSLMCSKVKFFAARLQGQNVFSNTMSSRLVAPYAFRLASQPIDT